MNSRGPYHFYDGLEIVESGDSGRAEQVLGTNLGLFSMNGVTFDRNWAGLVSFLGEPTEYQQIPESNYYVMWFDLENYLPDYMMEFWFSHPDDPPYNMAVRVKW